MADVSFPLPPNDLARIQAAGLMGPFQRFLDHIKALTTQIQDLKARLSQNSQVSSRPPSQDPPGTSPVGGKPEGEGKSGARPGHGGSHRELLPLNQIDAIVARDLDSCLDCGLELAQAPRQRLDPWCQVTELPEIRPTVTMLQLWEKRCPCCGARPRGQLPGNGPDSAFGPDLQATDSLSSGAYHLTFSQVHNLLKSVFHLSMSIGSIQAYRKVTTQASAPACQALLAETRAVTVVHADKTGFEQCQGTRRWLWVSVTPGAEVFLILPGRGQAQAENLQWADFAGVIERDRWKPYERFEQAEHQFCWSHICRNLQGLNEVPGETAVQATMMKLASNRAFVLWYAYQAGILARLQLARRMRSIRDEIHDRLRFILTDSRNTRRRLALADFLRQETSFWTYVRRAGVYPTNNAPERSLRPAGILRKISYGVRFPDGCRFGASNMAIVVAAKRRGFDPWVRLTNAIRAVRQGDGPPFTYPLSSNRRQFRWVRLAGPRGWDAMFFASHPRCGMAKGRSLVRRGAHLIDGFSPIWVTLMSGAHLPGENQVRTC